MYDNDFKDVMKLYKKCTTKPYSFFVNDTTLPSDNPLRFRCNLLGRTWNVIMVIDEKIRDKQKNIYREAAKISPLSSDKIDKYEYLTTKEILSSASNQMIEQAKFTYFLLKKHLENKQKELKSMEKIKLKPSNPHDSVMKNYYQ